MPHPTVTPHSRQDRELAFNAARGLLAQAQQTHRHQLPHRALSRIRLNPWLLLQMVGLPVVWLSLIYALREPLYGFGAATCSPGRGGCICRCSQRQCHHARTCWG